MAEKNSLFSIGSFRVEDAPTEANKDGATFRALHLGFVAVGNHGPRWTTLDVYEAQRLAQALLAWVES